MGIIASLNDSSTSHRLATTHERDQRNDTVYRHMNLSRCERVRSVISSLTSNQRQPVKEVTAGRWYEAVVTINNNNNIKIIKIVATR